MPNRFAERIVTVRTEGPVVLAGLGSANPSSEDCYQAASCRTFDGRVLAVVRSLDEEGEALVHICAEGCEEQVVRLHVGDVESQL